MFKTRKCFSVTCVESNGQKIDSSPKGADRHVPGPKLKWKLPDIMLLHHVIWYLIISRDDAIASRRVVFPSADRDSIHHSQVDLAAASHCQSWRGQSAVLQSTNLGVISANGLYAILTTCAHADMYRIVPIEEFKSGGQAGFDPNIFGPPINHLENFLTRRCQ